MKKLVAMMLILMFTSSVALAVGEGETECPDGVDNTRGQATPPENVTAGQTEEAASASGNLSGEIQQPQESPSN